MQQQHITMAAENRLYAASVHAVQRCLLASKKEMGVHAETIGERLARLRKEKGVTQAELARALDTAQPVVSDYERGNLRLHGEVIARLARILHISADELLGIKDSVTPRRGPRDTRLARLLRDVEALPRRDKDALLRTIESVVRAKANAA